MSAKADLSLQESGDLPSSGCRSLPLRPISFRDPKVTIDRRADGTIYLRPQQALVQYPARLTDSLHHWASVAPDRLFMAERDHHGGWRKITYAELLSSSHRIASGLLARDLSAERPVVILSGNSIDHALMSFGAMLAGVPFCPVSPAYSLISKDHSKLVYLMRLLTPGLVFANDADQSSAALQANMPSEIEVVASRGRPTGRAGTALSDLL